MSRVVSLTRLARADLLRLADFLARHSPDAAARAGEAIVDVLRSLADHSDRGRPSSFPGLRELPIRFGRDGYIVRYRVEPEKVIISRIFHARERRTGNLT